MTANPSWRWNRKTGEKKLFQLEPGDEAPTGWVDTPAKIPGSQDFKDAEADAARVAKLQGKKPGRKAKAKAQPVESADDGVANEPGPVSTPRPSGFDG